MNPQLIEIASWRIVCELIRRFPDKFTVIETHPCSGMYDCLDLYDKQERCIAAFNRHGTFHAFGPGGKDNSWDVWSEMGNAYSPKEVLDRVCTMLGWVKPPSMPASTPYTLVYRFIATALSQAAFGIAHWECRNGMRYPFEKYPLAQNRLSVHLPEDLLRNPAYRFWFIVRDEKPVVCLETTGTAWSSDGKEYDLYKLYAKDRRIWPLVWRVMGQHLG